MWITSLGDVDVLVFYVFAAFAAINVVLALLALLLDCCCSKARTPGNGIHQFILFGCLCVMVPILCRGISEDWLTNVAEDFDNICQFYPALYIVGFTFINGGLLIKCACICYYCKGVEKRTGDAWVPAIWMLLMALGAAALIILWSVGYPIHLKTYSSGLENEYRCEGDNMDIFILAMSVIFAALLLVDAIIVWRAIYTARGTIAIIDARASAAIIYNKVAAVIAGTLIYLLLDASATLRYAIIGGLILYVVLFTEIAVLVTIILTSRQSKSDKDEDLPNYSEINNLNRHSSSKSDRSMIAMDPLREGREIDMPNNDLTNSQVFQY